MGSKATKQILLLLVLGAGLEVQAAPASGARFPISGQAVAQAIVAGGGLAEAGEVEFLNRVSASRGDYVLHVTRFTAWRPDVAVVQLRCRDSQECLPFNVLLYRHQAEGLASVVEKETTPPIAGRFARSGSSSAGRLVRSGDRVTMFIERPNLRISLPVICLENGRDGQTIRVASRDHRHIYRAIVFGSNLVKGTL